MPKTGLYLASTEELAGKSVLALSLALLAKDSDRRAGYFKPIGIGHVSGQKGEILDEDVEAMRQNLGLQHEHNVICPITLLKGNFLSEISGSGAQQYGKRIVEAYGKASEGKDLMFVEAPPTLSTGSFMDCPVPKLATDLGLKILVVSKFKDDHVVDEVLQARDYCLKWGSSLLGVVLNQIPKGKIDEVERVIKPFLENKGVKVLGQIPEDKVLGFMTVGEVYDAIGGKVLAGKDGMENTIHEVLVGAMTPESALRYFRRAKNELVVTGGDRTDIILAALEAGASGLILTGNLYPSVKFFPRADELAVPIILVPHDTYSTLREIEKIVGRIKAGDKKRIAIAKKLVKENVDWKQILQAP